MFGFLKNRLGKNRNYHAFLAGREARTNGCGRQTNPEKAGTKTHQWWHGGWDAADYRLAGEGTQR